LSRAHQNLNSICLPTIADSETTSEHHYCTSWRPIFLKFQLFQITSTSPPPHPPSRSTASLTPTSTHRPTITSCAQHYSSPSLHPNFPEVSRKVDQEAHACAAMMHDLAWNATWDKNKEFVIADKHFEVRRGDCCRREIPGKSTRWLG